MADEIGISASYLNHLERNQRPVTAGILLRLAEAFDIDMKAFASEGGDTAGADQLAEIFSDAMLADLGIGRAELIELADNAPGGLGRRRPPLHRSARASAAAPRRGGRGVRRRPARLDYSGNLGPRLHPGAAQPLSGAGGALRDARRGAERPAFGVRSAPAPSQGCVRGRGPGRLARAAREFQPALRCAAADIHDLGAAPGRESHVRPRLSACSAGTRALAGAHGRKPPARPTQERAHCST